jgi:hypothetical protein
MFTVNMYCSRMMARGIRIGLVVDCTALDLEDFDPLPDTSKTSTTLGAGNRGKTSSAKKKKNPLDRRVRYFHNPSEWDDFDVEYHRLMPPKTNEEENGSSEEQNKEPLAPQLLREFFHVITKFIQRSRSATDKGNATTTHISLFDSRGGLGVASYLAAAYMCQTMKAPVHAALEAVKEGSPAQPEDKDVKWGLRDVLLVKDLQTRYKGSKEIAIEGGVPSWWWAIDDEEENEDKYEANVEGEQNADVAHSGDEAKASPKRKRSEDERIVIPPCEVVADEGGESKRQRTDDHMPPPGVTPSLFPNLPKEVLEPVSMDSQKATRAITVLAQLTQKSLPLATLPLKPEVDVSDITSLEEGNGDTNNMLQSMKSNPDGYKVTWLSTKGRRGLLLILTEAVYFIEQPNEVSIVTNIKFPSPKDVQKQQHRTLLDVVLVHDVENNGQCFRFYILDILCIEGGMVFHKPWKERWRFLNDGLLMPRKKEEAKQLQLPPPASTHVYAKEPIRIRAKEYFPLQKLEFVMKDVCAGVGHEAKGIRIIPMGGYCIGKGDSQNETAAVWKRGGASDEQQLSFLLLS